MLFSRVKVGDSCLDFRDKSGQTDLANGATRLSHIQTFATDGKFHDHDSDGEIFVRLKRRGQERIPRKLCDRGGYEATFAIEMETVLAKWTETFGRFWLKVALLLALYSHKPSEQTKTSEAELS